MAKFLYLISGLFFFPLLLQAQDAAPRQVTPIDTERPGVGNSSRIMPQGFFQVETGLWYLKDETNFVNMREIHYPEVILRYGLLSFMELQAGIRHSRIRTRIINPFQPGNTTIEKGVHDLAMGTKFQLLKNAGLRPEAALETYFRLPVGSPDLKGNKTEPKLRLNFRNKLSEKFTLHYNVGLNWEEIDEPVQNETFSRTGIFTLALQYKISEKLNVFIESVTEKHGQDFQQGFDTGLTFQASKNLQIDAYTGYGISEEAPDFFASTGFSFRLPH